MPFYLYEAEYRNKPGTRSMDWTNPDPDTVLRFGPFETEAEANEKGMAQAWTKVDLCYHRVAVTTRPDFDPTDPATHDFVLRPDIYWSRPKAS